MKNLKLIGLVVFSIAFNCHAQQTTYGISIFKSETDNGQKEYEAQKEVKLKSGYSFTGVAGTSDNQNMRAYIDEHKIYDTPNNTIISEAAFNSTNVDVSKAVGAIIGSGSVGASGGFSYTIPIKTPKGTKEIQPGIAVSYSSQSGSGIAGMGWHISGLSAITRSGNSLYHDGKPSPVTLTNQDHFNLNGQRLILMSGVHGTDGAQYKTESENYAKVRIEGSSTSGPTSFIVNQKNGLTYYYGTSTDSKNQSYWGIAISWHLKKVMDMQGNYMLFHYAADGGQFRIKKIEYTGNSNTQTTPYNRVDFFYQKKAQENNFFIANEEMHDKYILRKISSSTSNIPFRNYHFEYGNDNINTYLNSVKESILGEELNKTTFKYDDLENKASTASQFGISSLPLETESSKMEYHSGDFNGDGLTDLLGLNYIENSNKDKRRYLSWKIYLKTEGNTFQAQEDALPQPILGRTRFKELHPKSDIGYSTLPKILVGDINGDGRDDIVLGEKGTNEYAADFNPDYYYYTAYFSNTNNNKYTRCSNSRIVKKLFNSVSDDFVDYIYGHDVTLGDFDGDGKQEMACVYTRNRNIYINSFSDRVNKYVVSNTFNTSKNTNSKLSTIDYNGDGISELIFTYVGKVSTNVYTDFIEINSISNQFIDATISRLNETKKTVLGAKYIPLSYSTTDLNGDGNQDLIVSNREDYCKIYYSKGNKEQPFGISSFSPAINVSDKSKYKDKTFNLDVNGDGKTDIVKLENLKIKVHINKGNNSYETFDLSVNYNFTSDRVIPTFGDFDGDGRIDILVNKGNNHPKIIYLDKIHKPQDRLLSKIKNGYGNVTEITYRSIIDKINYTAQDNASLPLIDRTFAFNVVYEVKSDNGVGGKDIMEYGYEGAKIHTGGKGFLGFQKTTVLNRLKKQKIEKHYAFEMNLHVPYIDSTKTYVDNQLISGECYLYYFKDLGNNRYSMHPRKIIDKDYMQGFTTTKDLVWDDYGNLLTEVTNTDNGLHITKGIYQYENHGSHIKNVRTKETIISTRKGQAPFTVRNAFYYNNDGSLKYGLKFENKNKEVKTEYEYDLFGNLSKKTTSAAGITPMVEQFKYDPMGRFVVKTIDPMGQSTKYTYHPRYGKPKTSTDTYGLTTQFEYTKFGDLCQTTAPNGDITKSITKWDISDEHLIKRSVSSVQSPFQVVWLDHLLRPIKTKSSGLTRAIYTHKSFNNKGQLIEESLPYFEGGVQELTTYTYDKYGRPKTVTSPVGITNYSYSYANKQLTTTVVSPLQTTSSTIDATQKIVKKEDDGGILTFNYFSGGVQKDIHLNGNLIASVELDDYGRQKSLNDVNAGITNYVYDAFGRLTSQTDAKDQTTTLAYDNYGRNYQKVSPEGTRTTEYVNSGYGKNQIRKVTAENGDSQTFTYDNWHRLKEMKDVIDGQSYVSSYIYNDHHQLKRTNYASGFYTENEYNHHGRLLTVTANGNQLIFTAKEQNALGQYTKYQYGDDMTINKSYNKVGMPESYTWNGVQELSYDFELETGNLLSRTDILKGLTENFGYDDLNRLTSAGSNTFDYFDNGNIKTKSDVSSSNYQYDPVKSNAVVQVNNTKMPISGLQNQNATYNSAQDLVSLYENGYQLNFRFDANNQRSQSKLTYQGSLQQKKTYLSNMEVIERDGSVQNVHYIGGGDGLAAVYVEENGIGNYYFVGTDYLGSILTLADKNGNVVQEQSFDAWGRYRNTENWTYEDVNPPTLDIDGDFSWLRGYTSHEYLPQFSLIHMNGRLYDPLLGRMLSPDNFVHNELGSQGYNRYSYAGNNPLKYTDPDGENPLLAQRFFTGAIFGILSNGLSNIQNGDSFFKGAIKAGIIGGISGLISGGIGDKFTGAQNILAHGVWGGISSEINGGDFKTGFITGGAGAAFGQALGIDGNSTSKQKFGAFLATSAFSGFTAKAQGGDFWEGARQGATSAALNALSHELYTGGNKNPYSVGESAMQNADILQYQQSNGGDGKTIIYQRTTTTDQSTTGTFSIPGTDINGYFLEPAGPSTTTPNLDQRIPAGTYNLQWHNGSKYQGVLKLSNSQVPVSRAILIHSGNYPSNTEGCLLPGCSVGSNFVGSSKTKLNQVINHFNSVGINGATIIIRDPIYP